MTVNSSDTTTVDGLVVDDDEALDATPSRKSRIPTPRFALAASLLIVTALTSLAGWLGFQAYQSHQVQIAHAQYLQMARLGAVNLTTIDWQHADADIQRILDSATGTFYDDFAKRSQPFIDVVKQAKSTSVGTVTAAGLESVTDNSAQVLVAMNVKTTNAGSQDPTPRSWRMRIDVQKVGNDVKVSNVEFVP